MSDWQPIETAPNDIVLVTDGGYVQTASPADGRWFCGWSGENFLLRIELKPTHWMPLPSRPSPPNE